MNNISIGEIERIVLTRQMQQSGAIPRRRPEKPERHSKNVAPVSGPKPAHIISPTATHVKIEEKPEYLADLHGEALPLPFSALEVLADSSAVEDECVDLSGSSKFSKFHIQRLEKKLTEKRDEISNLKDENEQMREALKSAVLELRAKREETGDVKNSPQLTEQRNPKFDLLENAEIRKLQRRNSELTNKLERIESSIATSALSTASAAEGDFRQLTYLKQSKEKLKAENDQLKNQNSILEKRITELQEHLRKSRANEDELGKVVIELSRVAEQ